MNKIVKYGIYIFLALAIIMLIYVEYLTFFQDNPPIEFKTIHIAKTIADNYIIVEVEACRYTDAPVTIYASYVNGIMYSLPPEVFTGKSLGCSTNLKYYEIPPELENGRYYLYGRNEYKVNSFATRIVEWKTDYFEINRTKGDLK